MRRTLDTVGQLIDALGAYPPHTRVMLAVQPAYPVAETIGTVACTSDDADVTDCPDPAARGRVVWIAAGERVGYLPSTAADALGQPWAS